MATAKEIPEEGSGAVSRWGREWRALPAYMRYAALTVPVILIALPILSSSSMASASGSSLKEVRASLAKRATIDFYDDFREGLGQWDGGSGWASSWTYDKTSFILPGSLALYQRSTSLSDYRVELMGQIVNRSMAFVIRASDLRNYYVIKIQIVKPGPLPQASIVRYAVVDGVEGPKSELPMPLSIREDTLYSVVATVKDANYSVSVNGQLVDHWTDTRHPSGGVGFFAEPGSKYRVRYVRVVDKDDFLGWVCSQLSKDSADITEALSNSAKELRR